MCHASAWLMMEHRWQLMTSIEVRNITSFNKKIEGAINEGKLILDMTGNIVNEKANTVLRSLPLIVVILMSLLI